MYSNKSNNQNNASLNCLNQFDAILVLCDSIFGDLAFTFGNRNTNVLSSVDSGLKCCKVCFCINSLWLKTITVTNQN